eukprot:598770-Amphidinium_carterae.1
MGRCRFRMSTWETGGTAYIGCLPIMPFYPSRSMVTKSCKRADTLSSLPMKAFRYYVYEDISSK